MWPVDGVVGENGGLWFHVKDGRMVRRFAQPEHERRAHRERLRAVGERIVSEVPGTALASDQPYRELDLAVDFREDVPELGDAAIDAIVRIFMEEGATCKVSSIHVNGWYGGFDKLSGCRDFVRERWGEDLDATASRWIFVGDSANDEPMFAHFPISVGVANVARFLPRMSAWPRYVTRGSGGRGFAEVVDAVLTLRSS
jgi:hydroxymethylpyrimidine pyrophosphatase-like HAD family hydrolase